MDFIDSGKFLSSNGSFIVLLYHLIKMYKLVAIIRRINIYAISIISRKARGGGAIVVVFGKIDSPVGMYGFYPHDVSIGAKSGNGYGMDGWRIVYTISETTSGVAPSIGITPTKWDDAVGCDHTVGSITGALATIVTPIVDETEVVMRTTTRIWIARSV